MHRVVAVAKATWSHSEIAMCKHTAKLYNSVHSMCYSHCRMSILHKYRTHNACSLLASVLEQQT